MFDLQPGAMQQLSEGSPGQQITSKIEDVGDQERGRFTRNPETSPA